MSSLKILVINLMHIGDLLLVTPVLRTLRTNYPQAYIALLADAKLSDLVKYNQNIDELIAIDKKGYHNKLGNYIHFIAEIRQRRFNLVINLHANERASFIAAFSGADRIIGYSSWGLGKMFQYCIKNRKAVKH
ncbi:MAG: glycosyltransferase family 9 protein, partial [Veillonellales bacterium]